MKITDGTEDLPRIVISFPNEIYPLKKLCTTNKVPSTILTSTVRIALFFYCPSINVMRVLCSLICNLN